MKIRHMRFLAAGSILVLTVASDSTLLADPSAPPSKVKAHGITVNGRVTRIDPARKSLLVRDEAGKETPLSWTGATRIAGGALKTGDAVTVRYLDKDSKHIATYIRINLPIAAATPSPASLPGARTPTPSARSL